MLYYDFYAFFDKLTFLFIFFDCKNITVVEIFLTFVNLKKYNDF